jgi:saccharopine dehydrogenase-like NADP-dependent oxidoreductase
MRALRVFADTKLTGTQEVEVGGVRVPSKAFVRAHFLQHAAEFGGDGEWAFLVHVEVAGRLGDRPARREYATSHPPRAEWGTSATARVTGIPASIGAQKLARGEATRAGVLAPEACFDPASFFAELARRGIVVHERVPD